MIKAKQKLTGNLNAKQSLSSKLGNAIIYIDPVTQEKTIEPSKSKQIIIPDDGFNGLSKVTINKIADNYIIPSGEIEIKENGNYDVTDKVRVSVNVPEKVLGVKSITSNGTYKATDDNLDGYSRVDIEIGTGWQRPSDWWDTKSILKNAENIELDGVTYYPRYIVLLKNTTNKTNNLNKNACKAKVAKFSDNVIKKLPNDSSTTDSVHTWDVSYDKPCSAGYKTRYIMFYDDSLTSVCTANLIDSSGSNNSMIYSVLELIYGFGKFTEPYLSAQVSSNYKNVTCLQNFETLDNVDFETWNVTQYTFKQGVKSILNLNLPTLKHIVKINTYSGFILPNVLSINLPLLETADTFDINTSISIYDLPNYTGTSSSQLNFTKNLKKLKVPKFIGNYVFVGGSYLCEEIDLSSFSLNSSTNLYLDNLNSTATQYMIKELFLKEWHKSFDISALTCLTKSSLLDILNKMVDVTSESTTYTATFGVNKEKLEEDELAIATGKGWTIK